MTHVSRAQRPLSERPRDLETSRPRSPSRSNDSPEEVSRPGGDLDVDPGGARAGLFADLGLDRRVQGHLELEDVRGRRVLGHVERGRLAEAEEVELLPLLEEILEHEGGLRALALDDEEGGRRRRGLRVARGREPRLDEIRARLERVDGPLVVELARGEGVVGEEEAHARDAHVNPVLDVRREVVARGAREALELVREPGQREQVLKTVQARSKGSLSGVILKRLSREVDPRLLSERVFI